MWLQGRVDCGPRALQKLHPSWLAAVLLLDAGSALPKGGEVMFRPQPLHLLPGLSISDEALQKLRPAWLAAGLLLDAGSALTKGGQVMFRPRPLHELPELPSHVFSECVCGLPRAAKQPDRPPLKF